MTAGVSEIGRYIGHSGTLAKAARCSAGVQQPIDIECGEQIPTPGFGRTIRHEPAPFGLGERVSRKRVVVLQERPLQRLLTSLQEGTRTQATASSTLAGARRR
jgi:hypothetical protein